MKHLTTILLLIFVISCSSDKSLKEENEKLKAENKVLIVELEQRAAEAIMAQEEAERQAEMAIMNLEEAQRQNKIAEDLRQQLANCQ